MVKKADSKKKRIDPFGKIKRRIPLEAPGVKPVVYEQVTSNKISRLVKRAKEISQHLDEVKPLYSELDEITEALMNVKSGLEKHGVTIVDRFAEKNTAFKTVGIRRFELKWVRS